jgi:enediyne biosynthesis protein E4
VVDDRVERPSTLIALALCLGAHGSPAAAQIRFEDVAARAGVRHVVRNAETPQRYQIEPMIAGVALLDYDNDGRLDVYCCNGATIPGLEKSDASFSNRLYRNGPGLAFEDVTARASVAGAGYSMGAAAGDFDNDGWTDLYVTGVNRNVLYRNRGDGGFEDVTTSAGVAGEVAGRGKAWAVGAGFFDYDRDGDLDLFVVNYCVWSLGKDKVCGAPREGYRTYCHPDVYDPLPNILYRNDGNGRFTDVSAASGVGAHLGKGMGLAFADYDADGWLDAFVSNDAWRNFLFRNRGDGTFVETALRAGVAYIDAGRPVSGMGADFKDYDGDGRPDIFMSALSNETFPLFRNEGNGLFRDETFASRLGGLSLAWGGWSTGMVDLDNDGFLDLFVAGGHVQTNEELYSSRSSRQSNRVFQNLGDGTFRDVTLACGADFQQLGLHRGAAFGDLDDDGRVDAVLTRLNEPVEVFLNRTEPSGHYLLVRLVGTRTSRDGLGTSIRLVLPSGRSLVRHATSAVGYGGSSDKRVHFGLGGEGGVERLEVTWPSGHVQVLENVGVDRILEVREPVEAPSSRGAPVRVKLAQP